VLGAGSWGTALAIHLDRIGHEVRLWARDPALVRDMQARRANAIYLPDVVLPPRVRPTAALADALAEAQIVVCAVPSHGVRAVMQGAAPHVRPQAIVVSTAKGIEEGTLLRVSELLDQVLHHGHPVVVLSGPSFAAELARQQPTAVCVASHDPVATQCVQVEFRSPSLRLYASDDVVGVEIGGAMKNVIAIAAGVVEGLGIGQNAQAALVTRGLAEIGRLAFALGARRETLAGLSGLGDLVLTCTGHASRNLHLGIELGKGRTLFEVQAGMLMVAEGVNATHGVLALGRLRGVELPIAEQMEAVLAGRTHPLAATEALMGRPQKPE
jgi:glycerol-3-phosphate dehydrogenase (NAD(P)+)